MIKKIILIGLLTVAPLTAQTRGWWWNWAQPLNTGTVSEPAPPIVTAYDIGDSTFAMSPWNADPSTWWSNRLSTIFYPSGSGDYLAYDGSGTETVYNAPTYQVNVAWEHTGMTDKALTFEWYQAIGTNVSIRIRVGKEGDWAENIVNPSDYYIYGSYSSGYNTIDWTCPYDTINGIWIAFTTSDTCRIDYIRFYDGD